MDGQETASWTLVGYPLVNDYIAIQKNIEIVSFRIENAGSFHTYVNVYQRLSP